MSAADCGEYRHAAGVIAEVLARDNRLSTKREFAKLTFAHVGTFVRAITSTRRRKFKFMGVATSDAMKPCCQILR